MLCRRLLLVLLFGLVLPRTAMANIGRAEMDGEIHGPLVAQGSTTVRVDAEELSFTLADNLASADVQAVYKMTNGGPLPSGSDVAFVFVHGDATNAEEPPVPSIAVDGAAVSFKTIDDRNQPADRRVMWSNISARRLTWLVFRLDFAPGQSRTVEVHYKHAAAEDYEKHVTTTFAYDYLLSPAKSWASFGPLRITLKMPADTAIFSPTIPFVPDKDGRRAELLGLPDGELSFEVISKKGLLFGLDSPSSYFAILGALIALSTVPVARALGRRWGRTSRGAWERRLWCFFGTSFVVTALGVAVVWLAAGVFPDRAFGFGYTGPLGILAMLIGANLVGIAVSLAAASRTRPSPF